MKIKSYMGAFVAVVIGITGIGVANVVSGGAISSAATATINIVAKTPTEPEEALKTAIFSAEYENYLPENWFTAEKLTSGLTRKDAAYLAVHTLAKASGKSIDVIDYKTNLSDTKDPMLRRAVDLGLMSVGADLKFNGSKTVTQQEMAVIATKILVKSGQYDKPTKALTFNDKGKIADWAKESVQYLNQHGWLIWQSGKNFEPTKVVTLGRAISIMDQMLADKGVYEKTSATNFKTAKRYDVKGFKMPMPVPADTELSYGVNGSEHLQINFTGNLKDRTRYTNKRVVSQINEILDSHSKVTYDARASLVKAIKASFDANTQTYNFKQDLYITVDSGKVLTTKLSESELGKGYLHLLAGNQVNLEIIL